MNQTKQIINKIIQNAIDTQIPLLSAPIDMSRGDATPLFGADGILDSLGLVTLILSIEEMIEIQMSIAITIVSEKAMSARRSPFSTIDSLAKFIDALIQEKTCISQ